MTQRSGHSPVSAGPFAEAIADRAETTAYLILFFILMLHLVAAITQLAGGRFAPVPAALLLTVSAAASHLLARLGGARPTLAEWAAAILIGLGSLLMGGSVFDFTVDGNAYHFQSIDAFAHGWNRLHDIPPDAPGRVPPLIWSLTYPTGHWLVMAVPISAGLPDEMAKGIWLALAIALMLLGATVLRRVGLPIWFALPAAMVAVANPIFLQQMGSRMNDGIVSLLLAAFAFLALSAAALGDRRAFVGLGLTVILLVNTKFSLVPITVAVSAVACLLAWRGIGLSRSVRIAAVLLVAGASGLLIIGFSPYVVNTARHGHPFYPVMGPDKQDIMSSNTPSGLAKIGYPLNFWASALSVTNNKIVELKIPFRTDRREIHLAGSPDARMGGMGPLFSGILLLALATVAACLAARPLVRGQSLALSGALLLLLLGAFFPEGWWARYVPFVWLVPLAIALAGALSRHRAAQVLAAATLLAMGANSALIFSSAAKRSYRQTQMIQAELARLKASPEPVRIDFGLNEAFRAKVQRAGIPHKDVSFARDGRCPGAVHLAGSVYDIQGFRCPLQPTAPG